jgi:hypothetical protein
MIQEAHPGAVATGEGRFDFLGFCGAGRREGAKDEDGR